MQKNKSALPLSRSLLDVMIDGNEYESLLRHQFLEVDLIKEIKRSIAEITGIRGRPLICYVSNVVSNRGGGSTGIDSSDDLPFNEMIRSLPPDTNEVDIVVVTPGGAAQQVAKFVNALRPRFKTVGFLVLSQAMSAGTIFVMSGDEIVMTDQSNIGPIDPQVLNKSGFFVPAQAILTLIEEMRVKGEEQLKKGLQPSWTDIQLLRNIDPKEIGHAMTASNYSIKLVKEYLYNYKFKTWERHSDGRPVTDEEKEIRANEIASLLCDHSKWNNHGHAITRESAWEVCKLKIKKAEEIEGLDRAMRRMWALFYWIFENTPILKFFISQEYSVYKSTAQNIKK